MLSILSLFLLCAGCERTSVLDDGAVQDVTIADLVSNPDFYNNAIVRITGASYMGFEANYVCATVSDVEVGGGEKCLWLSPVVKKGLLGPLDPALYHKKLVTIVGVFDKDFHGHMGAYGGAIAPISAKVLGTHDQGDPPPPEPTRQPYLFIQGERFCVRLSSKHLAGVPLTQALGRKSARRGHKTTAKRYPCIAASASRCA